MSIQPFDSNGDGYADQYLIDSNGDGYAETWASDLDQDGRVERLDVDTDGDGQVDTAVVDYNEDGVVDYYADTRPDIIVGGGTGSSGGGYGSVTAGVDPYNPYSNDSWGDADGDGVPDRNDNSPTVHTDS